MPLLLRPTHFSHAWKVALALASILGLAAALYGHTLHFPWQFDDERYLLENPLVTQVESFTFPPDLQDFVDDSRSTGLHRDLWINFVLRPVSYFTFFINHQLSGFKPESFRLVNIVIHAVNGVLVFALVWLLLKLSSPTSRMNGSVRLFTATAAAWWFTAHPLHTESVTYIVQRFTSLGTFFYLLALVIHLASHVVGQPWKKLTLRLIAASVVLGGMLTKEITVTLPLVMLLTEVALLRLRWRQAISNTLPSLLLLPVIPAMVFATEHAFSDGQTTIKDAMNIVEFTDQEHYQYRYLITQAPVVLDYLRLLLVPTGQNVDPQVTMAKSVLEPRVAGSLLLIAAIFLTGSWLMLRTSRESTRLIGYGIGWFFITISVTSSFIPLPDLMAEHHTYLPAVGFAIAFAVWLSQVQPTYAWTLLVLWTAGLGIATVNRNEVWRSELSLWMDSASKSPQKPRPAGNVAVAWHRMGNDEACETWLKRSLQLGPGYKASYLNLARFYNDDTRTPEKALGVLSTALKRWPDDEPLVYYHALTLARLGRLAEAKSSLEKLLTANPVHGGAHATLGEIYLTQNQPIDAERHLRTAVELGLKDDRLINQIQALDKRDKSR